MTCVALSSFLDLHRCIEQQAIKAMTGGVVTALATLVLVLATIM